MRAGRVLGVVLGVLVALAGCTTRTAGPHRGPPHEQPTTGPGRRRRAASFGAVVLPPMAEVLFADQRGFTDTLVRLSLRTDPAGVAALLTASGFTTPLARTTSPGAVPAGPDPADSPSVLTAQDSVTPAGSRVYRTIVVDERDATTRFVHWSLFTT